MLVATLAITSTLSIRPSQASYIVTLQQVGSNVVATGSGAIDLTDLILNVGELSKPLINPEAGGIWVGQTSAFGLSTDHYRALPFTGPANFGSGSFAFANSGSGDLVGINGGFNDLWVPSGYVSNTFLSGSATWDSASFSSLGVTLGTYEWTWGTGPNQNFTLDVVAPAVPDAGSTFGLLCLALAALFGASRIRSHRLA